jgi:Protein of unknown function (DUF2946)
MRALRRHHHLHAWIAIATLLLAALVPTLSHALAFQIRPDRVEICTAQGMQWVGSAESGLDGSTPEAIHFLEHCPFCLTPGPVLGLPAADPLVGLLAGLSDAPPSAFLAAPRRLYAWASAQPRAPPFAS